MNSPEKSKAARWREISVRCSGVIESEVAKGITETNHHASDQCGSDLLRSRDFMSLAAPFLSRLAGFEVVDHAPEAVGFAALDDLERRGTIEGRVWLLHPVGDFGGDVGKAGDGFKETLEFGELAGGGLGGLGAGLPVCDGSRRVAAEADDESLAESELGAEPAQDAGGGRNSAPGDGEAWGGLFFCA